MFWFAGRGHPAAIWDTELYAKRSRDGGGSWGPDVQLTTAPSSSMHATMAAGRQSLHVVWFDRRDGNEEIYYKRAD
jgi:hypothetical protein